MMASKATTQVTKPVRMEPLATLPVFLKLAGKRVVLAGGSAPAVWKAELLCAAGALVEVFATDPCPDLLDLAANPPGGVLVVTARAWTGADLVGAAVALGAIDDDEEAGAFRDAARIAGTPVNVIDKPAFCDFQFGTIVARSPLIVGISTDGAAPVFGQAIRARIEALLPQSFRTWALAAKDWRPSVQALNLDFRRRRRFWEAFTERAFANSQRDPEEADLLACQIASREDADENSKGHVTLVSAGPGHPDDVTLRSIRALQSADVVLHGPDIAPAIIGFARREAVKIAVVHHGGEDLPDAVSALTTPGLHVAWLDKGAGGICLRWAERHSLLRDLDYKVSETGGSGLCPDCLPACPAWRAAPQ